MLLWWQAAVVPVQTFLLTVPPTCAVQRVGWRLADGPLAAWSFRILIVATHLACPGSVISNHTMQLHTNAACTCRCMCEKLCSPPPPAIWLLVSIMLIKYVRPARRKQATHLQRKRWCCVAAPPAQPHSAACAAAQAPAQGWAAQCPAARGNLYVFVCVHGSGRTTTVCWASLPTHVNQLIQAEHKSKVTW